ncbi:MAG: ATP-binding protein [Myxococcota bacterium]
MKSLPPEISADALASVVRLISDGVVSIDARFRIVYVNDAALEMFGFTREELLGQPLDLLLPPQSRSAHEGHVRSFGREEGAARLMGERRTIRGCRRDGRTFPAEASIVKVGPPEARVFTAILRDITERVRLETEQRVLAEAGAMLAGSLDFDDTLERICGLVVPSLADFAMVDLRDDQGEFRRVAALAAERGRQPVADALKRFPLDRARAHLAYDALVEGRPLVIDPVTDEELARNAQDEDHHALLRQMTPTAIMVVPLAARDVVLGAFVLVSARPEVRYGPHDLALATELARRAAVAVDNARLYRASVRATAARDEVLAMVAHDLRNPIGGIGMAAGLLVSRLEPIAEAKGLVKAAQGIRAATDRMERLIGDLVEVTRCESGQLSLERVPAPPDRLVSEAVGAVAGEAERRAVTIHADVPVDTPLVDGDPIRLVQVLVNLVGNAVKFVPEGGTVEVRARGAGPAVEFAVSDDGPGVPAGHVPHLFDRFWQGRATDRRGVGLGLSIARGIVEAHGGRIWVESEPGHGATFRFTVPAGR